MNLRLSWPLVALAPWILLACGGETAVSTPSIDSGSDAAPFDAGSTSDVSASAGASGSDAQTTDSAAGTGGSSGSATDSGSSDAIADVQADASADVAPDAGTDTGGGGAGGSGTPDASPDVAFDVTADTTASDTTVSDATPSDGPSDAASEEASSDAGPTLLSKILGKWVGPSGDGALLTFRFGAPIQSQFAHVFANDYPSGTCEGQGNWNLVGDELTLVFSPVHDCPGEPTSYSVSIDVAGTQLTLTASGDGGDVYVLDKVAPTPVRVVADAFEQVNAFGCGEDVDLSMYFLSTVESASIFYETNSFQPSGPLVMDEFFPDTSVSGGDDGWSFYDANDTGRLQATYPLTSGPVHNVRGIRADDLTILHSLDVLLDCSTGVVSSIVEVDYTGDITRHRFVGSSTGLVTVTGEGTVQGIEVMIEKTALGSLPLSLRSPTGTVISLAPDSFDVSPFAGDVVVFTADAALAGLTSAISDQVWSVNSDLDLFLGEASNGTWTLEVDTDAATPNLQNFSIAFRH